MWAKIKSFFAHISRQSSMDWQVQQYLNSAQNVYDLEYRIRRVSQGKFQ
jgi:hypothetical protein